MQLPLNRKDQECPCGFINLRKGKNPIVVHLCTRCGKDCYGDSHMCAECWGLHSAFHTKEEVGRKRLVTPATAHLPEEDNYG